MIWRYWKDSAKGWMDGESYVYVASYAEGDEWHSSKARLIEKEEECHW